MLRTVLIGVVLVGLGIVAGAFVGSRGISTDLPAVQEGAAPSEPAASRGSLGTYTAKAGGDGHAGQLERRLDSLAAQVAAEAAERQRLRQRIEAVTAELAALRGAIPESGRASSEPNATLASRPSPGEAAPSQATEPSAADGVSGFERALVAAGVDSATAADIKHRQDGLALEEIYLRDQATREQWLDSPRFADEMAKIERQRTSLRDEIGDDAYDRYLAASGQPNRVTVNDVLLESAAAQAGLQAGDVVLRYGETRIFAPQDLVAETHGGTPGESVRIELMRNGQLVAVDVPRGPLGVNIAPVPAPAPSAR